MAVTKSANKTGHGSGYMPCARNSGGSERFEDGKTVSASSGFRSLQFKPANYGSNSTISVEEYANSDGAYSIVRTSGVQMIGGPKIDGASVCLSVSLNGEHELRAEEKTLRVRERDVGISSGTEPNIFSRGEGVHKLLRLPPEVTDGLPQLTTGPVVVLRESPVADVLKTIMTTLEKELREGSRGHAATIAKIANNVVSLLILENEKNQNEDSPALLRTRVRCFVEENIAAPDLSVTRIARKMNVSRATLYRLFSEVGGVRKFVTQVRLDTARRMLESGSLQRGHILDVGYRCGFSSPGAFSRAFKTHYGISPGEYCRKHVTKLGGQVN